MSLRPLQVDWLEIPTPLLPGHVHVDGQEQGAWPGPGRIGLSSCPGRPGQEQLRVDIAHLQRLCIGTVVSTVDDEEMRAYGVTHLTEALMAAGIRHVRFPCGYRRPPSDKEATRVLCEQLLALVLRGERVLIHCIGGWGRTGTLAACLLTHGGLDADRAIALVRACRSPMCLESVEQEDFVHAYADPTP